MPTFRPYTTEELRTAAEEYGLDPAFVEAVYATESSRGTNPNAMKARSVKRKRDTTIVRGPFQLEDDTTSDLIKRQKLGNVNVDDPAVHLDLAMRLMRELADKHDGDYRKMAWEYLGGPGAVKNPAAAGELGTTADTYGNRILAEMAKIQGQDGARTDNTALAMRMPPVQGLDLDDAAYDAGADAFGMPTGDLPFSASIDPDRVSWSDLVAANRSDALGIPPSLGGGMPNDDVPELDLDTYLSRILDEELQGKDFAHAA